MSKTGWTLAQAKDAKKSSELMCASLRRTGNHWQIKLHEWDGFKGPIEDLNNAPLIFATADLAINAMAAVGFDTEHFVNPSQSDAFSYVGVAGDVHLVVSSNGNVQVAVERPTFQVI
jgi:hypothetical protein